jgi:hypothetical protein
MGIPNHPKPTIHKRYSHTARSQKDSPRFSPAAGATVRQGRHEKLLPISCALAIAFIGGIVGYSPATLDMRIPSDEIINDNRHDPRNDPGHDPFDITRCTDDCSVCGIQPSLCRATCFDNSLGHVCQDAYEGSQQSCVLYWASFDLLRPNLHAPWSSRFSDADAVCAGRL